MPPTSKRDTLTSKAAAKKLDALIDRVHQDPHPVIICNAKDLEAVLLSKADYEMLVESADQWNRIETDMPDPSETLWPDGFFAGRPVPASDDYAQVFQFKITLEEVKPDIWRRIQMPANGTFWDLHVAVQDAMGWQDAHLHAFETVHPQKGPVPISSIPIDHPDDGRQGPPDWEVVLADHFTPDSPEVRYIYDFGDNWVHHIQLEATKPRDSQTAYPACVDGRRACPPEDCGGPIGYHGLLVALADPEDDDYEYWREWVGEGFDPEYFSAAEVVFDDPEDRWEDIFGDYEEDEEDDDWEEDIDRLELLRLTHEHMTRTWQRVQNDELEDLTSEDLRIARIMEEHKEVLFDELSMADLNPQNEFDPDSEVNPFLHITMHAIVEKQIEDQDPIEAFQFFNAMRKKKCAHHDALHLVGLILTPLIFRVLKNREPFDLPLYTALLNKYKHRNPARIPGLLESDPDWGFE